MNVQGRHVLNTAAHERPGDFSFAMHSEGASGLLVFRCLRCAETHAVSIRRGQKIADSWEWNGDMEKPTLSPSININRLPTSCGWHGWLRDGVWIGA